MSTFVVQARLLASAIELAEDFWHNSDDLPKFSESFVVTELTMHAEVPAILSQDVYSKYPPPPVINKQRKYIPTHHAYNSNNLVIFYGIALYYGGKFTYISTWT